MPLHIIKLCVGCDSLSELADWQKKRLKEKRAKGQKPELIHVTRMTPKRADEVLDGGSLYWVIKGQIAARQKLLALREVKKNGIPHCGLVYDKTLVPVVARPRRAFQGWRYLEAKDAPPDLAQTKGAKGLPEKLQRELAALGLTLSRINREPRMSARRPSARALTGLPFARVSAQEGEVSATRCRRSRPELLTEGINLNRHIVDQPGLADLGRRQDAGRAFQRGDMVQGFAHRGWRHNPHG